MKIIIVGASSTKSFSKIYHYNPSDYFIGLDAGAIEIINNKIKPDIAIGDFDSTNLFEYIKEKSYDTLVFPKMKNETDLELALMHLKNVSGSQYLTVEIYDCLNGRLDHEFVTYKFLEKYSDYKIVLKDEHNTIRYLKEGDGVSIKKDVKYFSFFTSNNAILSTENALYNLDEFELTSKDTFAISNEILDKTKDAKLKVLKGSLFLFTYKE